MLRSLFILGIFSQTIPLGLGLYSLQLLSREMKVLVGYFSLALIAELAGVYLALQGINNLWLVHVFTIVEYGFFVWVFSSWQKNTMLRRILRLSILLLSIMGIIAMVFLEDIRQFNASSRSVASLILVAASAFSLSELSKESFSSVFRQPRFWVGCATLIYFSSSLVLFALSNVLLKESVERARMVFVFHIIMNIISNLIYAGAFLCQVQARKSGGPSSLEPSPS